jgi:adenylate kinase
MRAVVTGQIGMDKKQYLDRVAGLARDRGVRLPVFHLGDMMYAEARDIRPGRILDLPLSRLTSLRRAAIKDVIAATSPPESHLNFILNTHATFRWRHGLFAAFDFDQMQKLRPNMFICLVDNIEVVHERLHRDHDIDATLKDCMVWREEEILATELLAQACAQSTGLESRATPDGTDVPFFILSRGRHAETIETCLRLVTRRDMRKVYPSFPMSHVVDMPEVLREIDDFRAELAKHFISFDPGDVDEKLLLERAIAAAKEGKDWIEMEPQPSAGSRASGQQTPPLSMREGAERWVERADDQSALAPGPSPRARGEGARRVSVREVLDIAGDIDGQIYMRDFRLIDQSDMIVSYIPELPGGMPGLSSGVERELQHAFEHTKEVYVVWKPRKTPSPFITETATKIFKSVNEAMDHFHNRGMVAARDLFGN